MVDRTDVTTWCRRDVLEVIRGFIRDRGGLPVSAPDEDELTDRLCRRIGLEVRMHLDRQAWVFANATPERPRFDPTPDPDEPHAGFADDLPF